MRVKRHGRGGYIGTDKQGRFLAGTKSNSRVGAWVAIMLVPLVGVGLASPGMLGSLFGSLAAFGGPLIVMAGAGIASLSGLVMLWTSAAWGWMKLALTALVGWLLWELAFTVLEIGVEVLPPLSEIKEMWL